jgi:hypothetical protein
VSWQRVPGSTPGSEVILEGSPAGTIEPKKPILGRLVPFPIAAMGRSHKGLLPQGRDSVQFSTGRKL